MRQKWLNSHYGDPFTQFINVAIPLSIFIDIFHRGNLFNRNVIVEIIVMQIRAFFLSENSLLAFVVRFIPRSVGTDNRFETWENVAKKGAKVLPVYKDDIKSEASNYRPISVLPIVSKIIEKIIFNQLYEYMTTNNLLAESQHGFRP